ncbi:MAG TPA: hypothetical protein VGP68_24695 [Gemmataceae bacterium]|nr:hypothetical protein [Gemmataceae bacterium]
MNKKRLRAAFLVPFVLAALSGCSRSPLVQAKGRLTYKGKPVPSTYVIFHPLEEGKRESHGLTDDTGAFSLTFSRTEDGVYPGKHRIHLRYDQSADEELGKTPPKANKELRAVINKYGVGEKSPLTYEVKGGEFFDIVLPD